LLYYIQVKSCHPDHRGDKFRLNECHDKWADEDNNNQFVIFVCLGRTDVNNPEKNEGPRYWIAANKQVGQACKEIKNSGCQSSGNKERRFHVPCEREGCLYCLKKEWENNWKLFADLMPPAK